MPDHVHLCLSVPPKYSISYVVGFFKGKSAIRLHQDFSDKLKKDNKMAKCSICINPVEDNETMCQECKEYKPVSIDWKKKAKELKELTDKYKGKKYDAMVSLTGGKDSSFVLYYLTKVLGLRVLAVTWDNGLIREKAWENMRKCVEATNSTHEIFKWSDDTTLKALQGLFYKFSKVCYCPIFMAFGAFPIAIRENIPLIFNGFSEGQRESLHDFEMPDQITHKMKFKNFYKLWKIMLNMALKKSDKKNKDSHLREILGDLENCANSNTIDFYPVMIPLANYIDWTNMEKLEKTLSTIGWENPNKTSVHSSCVLEPIKGFLETRRNLSEVTAEINQMIRTGSITRDQGIKEMDKMSMDKEKPEGLEYFCDFFNISEEEFFYYADHYDKYPVIVNFFVQRFRQKVIDTVSWIMGVEKHTLKFV